MSSPTRGSRPPSTHATRPTTSSSTRPPSGGLRPGSSSLRPGSRGLRPGSSSIRPGSALSQTAASTSSSADAAAAAAAANSPGALGSKPRVKTPLSTDSSRNVDHQLEGERGITATNVSLRAMSDTRSRWFKANAKNNGDRRLGTPLWSNPMKAAIAQGQIPPQPRADSPNAGTRPQHRPGSRGGVGSPTSVGHNRVQSPEGPQKTQSFMDQLHRQDDHHDQQGHRTYEQPHKPDTLMVSDDDADGRRSRPASSSAHGTAGRGRQSSTSHQHRGPTMGGNHGEDSGQSPKGSRPSSATSQKYKRHAETGYSFGTAADREGFSPNTAVMRRADTCQPSHFRNRHENNDGVDDHHGSPAGSPHGSPHHAQPHAVKDHRGRTGRGAASGSSGPGSTGTAPPPPAMSPGNLTSGDHENGHGRGGGGHLHQQNHPHSSDGVHFTVYGQAHHLTTSHSFTAGPNNRSAATEVGDAAECERERQRAARESGRILNDASSTAGGGSRPSSRPTSATRRIFTSDNNLGSPQTDGLVMEAYSYSSDTYGGKAQQPSALMRAEEVSSEGSADEQVVTPARPGVRFVTGTTSPAVSLDHDVDGNGRAVRGQQRGGVKSVSPTPKKTKAALAAAAEVAALGSGSTASLVRQRQQLALHAAGSLANSDRPLLPSPARSVLSPGPESSHQASPIHRGGAGGHRHGENGRPPSSSRPFSGEELRQEGRATSPNWHPRDSMVDTPTAGAAAAGGFGLSRTCGSVTAAGAVVLPNSRPTSAKKSRPGSASRQQSKRASSRPTSATSVSMSSTVGSTSRYSISGLDKEEDARRLALLRPKEPLLLTKPHPQRVPVLNAMKELGRSSIVDANAYKSIAATSIDLSRRRGVAGSAEDVLRKSTDRHMSPEVRRKKEIRLTVERRKTAVQQALAKSTSIAAGALGGIVAPGMVSMATATAAVGAGGVHDPSALTAGTVDAKGVAALGLASAVAVAKQQGYSTAEEVGGSLYVSTYEKAKVTQEMKARAQTPGPDAAKKARKQKHPAGGNRPHSSLSAASHPTFAATAQAMAALIPSGGYSQLPGGSLAQINAGCQGTAGHVGGGGGEMHSNPSGSGGAGGPGWRPNTALSKTNRTVVTSVTSPTNTPGRSHSTAGDHHSGFGGSGGVASHQPQLSSGGGAYGSMVRPTSALSNGSRGTADGQSDIPRHRRKFEAAAKEAASGSVKELDAWCPAQPAVPARDALHTVSTYRTASRGRNQRVMTSWELVCEKPVNVADPRLRAEMMKGAKITQQQQHQEQLRNAAEIAAKMREDLNDSSSSALPPGLFSSASGAAFATGKSGLGAEGLGSTATPGTDGSSLRQGGTTAEERETPESGGNGPVLFGKVEAFA